MTDSFYCEVCDGRHEKDHAVDGCAACGGDASFTCGVCAREQGRRYGMQGGER